MSFQEIKFSMDFGRVKKTSYMEYAMIRLSHAQFSYQFAPYEIFIVY